MSTSSFGLRVCSVVINSLGEGLPCVYHRNTPAFTNYSKLSSTDPFNDFGQVQLGMICPTDLDDGGNPSNMFVATLIYELPTGQAGYAAAATLST